MVSESADFKPDGGVGEKAGGKGEAFGDRVRRAVIWRSGSQILAQIITWASTLLVIRLLNPADYGLFAMTQAILAFLTFLNGWGFASALVQSDSVDPFRIRQAFGRADFDEGFVHLEDDLADHLFGIFGPVKQIGDVGGDDVAGS